MSPYLHFGQISPLYLALQIKHADSRLQDAKAAFLEEMIVRRELAMNFANYTPGYDSYAVSARLGPQNPGRARQRPARLSLHPAAAGRRPKPTTNTGMRPCAR